MRFRALIGVIIVALAVRTADAQEPAKTKPDIRPIGIIRQNLYEGDFAAPRALCFDRKHGELWIADGQTNVVGIFTADGLPLFAFSAGKMLQGPARIAVDPEGRLLAIQGDRSRVRIFDYRGVYQRDLDVKGTGEKPSFGALAFDSAGNLYLGENTSGQILVYDRELKLRRHFGSRGNEEGQFQSIAAIAVDEEGNVYVVDHQVTAVQVFDRRGDFVRGWGKHEMGVENFSLPEGIALNSKGHVVVVDALRHEIKFFDREGKFLGRFGGYGGRPGQVAFPSDVAIDGKDRIYVAERVGQRVQVFELLEQPGK